MTEDEQAQKRDFVKGLVTATITRPSERDCQVMPGPSDLANPCDACVGRKIAESMGVSALAAPKTFSLAAWNGTAVHQKLEADLPEFYPSAERELTVPIASLKKLGDIEGHVDLYLRDWKIVTDYKTAWAERIFRYRREGVPFTHACQVFLYMYGIRNMGLPAETGALVYIPRDSNNVEDIWVASCPYQEDVVISTLERAQKIVDIVDSGNVDTLESDAHCFVCNRMRGGY